MARAPALAFTFGFLMILPVSTGATFMTGAARWI
jgi:hypothetical protein